MKKFLLTLGAALLGMSAFALPSVEPTAGKATVVFEAPEAACSPVINFVGDVQGYDPTAEDLPVAELVEGNWYKIVLPLEGGATQGKLCPRSLTGAGTWNYQAKSYVLAEGQPEWVSLADDFGSQNKIVLTSGCEGGVAYLTVTEWAADFCKEPNPAGEASFEVTFEIPEEVDPQDIVITVYGMGDDVSWKSLGELSYDEDFEVFMGNIDIPAGCQYKYAISYQGGENIYMKGDNINMPASMKAVDEVEEWDSNPWSDPVPSGSGVFSVEFVGGQPADGAVVYIAGNFPETPEWERVNVMIYNTVTGRYETEEIEYPENFKFKFVIRNGAEEQWLGVDGGDDNFTFDGYTFDYQVPLEVPADEEDADEKASVYKVREGNQIIIISGDRKINLIGAEVK